MTRLVLLSGWGIDAGIWGPLAGFWPEGLGVATPDWPGYRGRPALADPADLNSLAEAMADDLPPDAVWVGWSLGGLLAAALLDYLPAPRALVLLGMGARFCHDGATSHAALTAFRRAFARDPDATLAHFQRWQLAGEPDPRAAYRRLRALLGNGENEPGDADRASDPATLAAGLDQLAELDNRVRLARAPCPVWRIAGERDPLLAPALRESADHRLADAGHCPMLSQPASLTACLAGIAGVNAP